MPTWNADTYLQFEEARTRPTVDLAARLFVKRPASVLDIGCGPGNSAAVLKRQFPSARVTGIDNSDEMLKAAKKLHPDIEFQKFDARELSAFEGRFDVVFSNAAFQWIPDHRKLIQGAAALVAPGGELAVQIPYNERSAFSKLLSRTVKSVRWSAILNETRPFYTLRPDAYYDVLTKYFSDIELWETDYCHVFDSADDVLRFYEGTALRFYLEQLNDPDKARFLAELSEGVKKAYKPRKDGKILFRFNRLFFIARGRK